MFMEWRITGFLMSKCTFLTDDLNKCNLVHWTLYLKASILIRNRVKCCFDSEKSNFIFFLSNTCIIKIHLWSNYTPFKTRCNNDFLTKLKVLYIKFLLQRDNLTTVNICNRTAEAITWKNPPFWGQVLCTTKSLSSIWQFL